MTESETSDEIAISKEEHAYRRGGIWILDIFEKERRKHSEEDSQRVGEFTKWFSGNPCDFFYETHLDCF